ncbi:MAG: UDP-3-O-(3-hydroxymyristoyl)glucosamine N-acyltransferase [Xanthomonadales bacterium]|nr:UDP-3-O-(3-hydroxymyristoyl)glucosamine N-acyltransferase [Xanthomonadales bacterium]
MIRTQPSFRLAALAERFGLELHGDGDHEVRGVGTLSHAESHELSFLSNRSYRRQLRDTRAGCVVLGPEDRDICPVSCLVADDPYVAYARIAELFAWKRTIEPGVHPSAVVHASAQIGDGAAIGANAVVEASAEIGAGCQVGPGCYIGAGVQLGESCVLHANVTVCDLVRIGKRVIIHPGAVIGADGFGLAFDSGQWRKVPQLGSVVIGDDCEIGANTAIDRGAIEDTTLGNDVRVDNLVQIGHNVVIGDHSAIAGCTGIAGSTRIGRNCLLGGGVGILGHIEIADGVTVGGMSAVNRGIDEAGSTWSSAVPARPIREWQRVQVHLRKLDDIASRIRALESKLGKNTDHE